MKRLHPIFLTAILIAVALSAFGVTAHAETEEIISDAFKYMWKTDWSPDGKYIAFSAKHELYIVSVETGEVIHLTENIDDNCTFPIFSHDGSKLFFSWHPPDGERYDNGEGYLIMHTDALDLTTGERTPVLKEAYALNVSRDGRYAVYVKEMRCHAVYDFQTGEETIYDFTETGEPPIFECGHSEFSPDNSYFITTCGALKDQPSWLELNDYYKLYKVDRVTGEAEVLEIGDLSYWYPRYSPDGTKLVISQIDNYSKEVPRYPMFILNEETGELEVYTGEDIYMEYVYVIDPETGEFVNLSYESYFMVEGHQDIYGKDTNTGEYFLVEDPGWRKTITREGMRYEVVIYDLATGELSPPIVNTGYFETKMASWSPDGTQLCYVLINQVGNWDIITSLYIYNIEQCLHKLVVRGDTPEETAVEKTEPTSFAITGNYPNPFNPSTTIEFSLEKAGDVRLDIYNVMGQKVRELVSEALTAGSHSVVWDGRDSNGVAVSSGVYISRLKMGEQVQTNQMMLVK